MNDDYRCSQSAPFKFLKFAVAGMVTTALMCCSVSAGGFYSYTDENGVMHFTNVPSDSRFSSVPRKRLHGSISLRKPATASGTQTHLTSPTGFDSSKISCLVSEAARQHGLDPALINAIIEVESGGRSSARSPKGAVGLMQLMPETAAEMGVRNRHDSRENIRGGTGYFKRLLEKFNGDIVLALAAYNAGPAAVEKYRGIPPYLETVRYVRKVLEAWNRHRKKYTKPTDNRGITWQ